MKIHKKIMIVEDHPAYRAGLTQVIQGIKNLDLVGTAENGKIFLDLPAGRNGWPGSSG